MEQYQIYLTKRDAARNMQRYYQLSLDRTLFGGLVLTRRWGRIGRLGSVKQEEVETEIRGLEMLLQMLKAKRQRGYASNVVEFLAASRTRSTQWPNGPG
jgi:predicted DNA-binding WGR domain protein